MYRFEKCYRALKGYSRNINFCKKKQKKLLINKVTNYYIIKYII